jgi:hypothetical protein
MPLEYVDKVSGQVHIIDNVQHQGWLMKQSEWIKDWRNRYFFLKGSKLFFAKEKTVNPHGMIDLSDCLTVKSAEMKIQKKNAIEVSTKDGQTYFMFAKTDQEKDEWIGAIGRSIVQSGSTYQDDEPLNSDEEDD